MTHWELEACVDAYKIANNVKPSLKAPTDEEYDEWVSKGANKKQSAA